MQFLYEHHLGNEFEAIITGFSAMGMFVSLERFLVEGLAKFDMIKRSSKRNDKWIKMEGTGRIVAQRSGEVLSVGDRVIVQITSIDLPTRQMELRVTKMPHKTLDELEPDPEPVQHRTKEKSRKKAQILKEGRGNHKKSKQGRKGKGRKRR